MSRSSSTKTTVKTGALKAHLAKYLRQVRAGKEVTVFDRNLPIAKIIPFESEATSPLEILPAKANFQTMLADFKVPAVSRRLEGATSLELLLEDREK